MLLTRLRDYYGATDFDTEIFVRNSTKGLIQDKEDKMFQVIIDNCPRQAGFPKIETLKQFMSAEEKKRIYYWSVCGSCGCEFDYKFVFCPSCYERGQKITAHSVRMSDVAPGSRVIKYNLTHLPNGDGEKVCFDCPERKDSFCGWFGNSDHFCNNEDREFCSCKACCARYKKMNRQYYDMRKVS